MPPKTFKCKQCGHCCIHLLDAFTTGATDEDVEMWERDGSDDTYGIELSDDDKIRRRTDAGKTQRAR